MSNQDKVVISKTELYDLLLEKSEGKENITFIFGAGASFGYTEYPHIRYVPPVVADLFNEANPTVKTVINDPRHVYVLRQRDYLIEALENFDNDLEKYLSFLYNRNDDDETFSDILIYIQDLCWLASKEIDIAENNYINLINRMCTLRGRLPWSCISFNYDTIFEKSFVAAGRDRTRHFNDSNDYLSKTPKVLKMHGSINFRYTIEELKSSPRRSERNVFSAMMREKTLSGSSFLAQPLEAKLPEFLSGSEKWNSKKQSYEVYSAYNYPLMMIPIHNTKRPEHPFFQDILEEARREIDASSLVIAVGYNFGDELLLEQLKKIDLSNKELILVGTNTLHKDPESHRGYQNSVNNWIGARIRVFEGNGFGDFVRAAKRRLPTQ